MAYVGKAQHFYDKTDTESLLPNTLSHKTILMIKNGKALKAQRQNMYIQCRRKLANKAAEIKQYSPLHANK